MYSRNKGQIAIWVIVALAIAVALTLVFLIKKNLIAPSVQEVDPTLFIRQCVKEAVDEASDIMLPQGGFIAPKNFKRYQYTQVEYLCENQGYFRPCINQHPLLLREMEHEIETYLSPRLTFCFSALEQELGKRDYTVTREELNFSVTLGPDAVYVAIPTTMTLQKNTQVRRIASFDTQVTSSVHDLGKLALLIANEEAQYCYFEYVGYMLLYPRFDIQKFTLSDSTRIYTLKDKYSNMHMNIALRGCAIPPGI